MGVEWVEMGCQVTTGLLVLFAFAQAVLTVIYVGSQMYMEGWASFGVTVIVAVVAHGLWSRCQGRGV